MKSNPFPLLFLGLAVFLSLTVLARPLAAADSKIKITATTSTFAALTQAVTGNEAEIYSIASPKQNLHFINPTPKDVLKTRRCDVFVHGGLDLEAWRGPLLEAAGRQNLISGEKAINASLGIPLLNPPASLSRIQGDVHQFGNPHYWTDPVNARIIAQNIAAKLSVLYPDKAGAFKENLAAFEKKIDEKLPEWTSRLAPYKNQKVVTYHDSWPYFMERFGLVILGHLEPNPGIPPTPRHLEKIIRLMKEQNAKVIIKQVYNESRGPGKAAKETGAVVITLAQEAGETKGDYFQMVEENVQRLKQAFKEKTAS